jgi:hypothetical protein
MSKGERGETGKGRKKKRERKSRQGAKKLSSPLRKQLHRGSPP